jgi:streptogramin lyase
VTEPDVVYAGPDRLEIAAPANALWFTETSHAQIARISTSGAITEYVQGVKQRSDPDCIVQAADHNMWFTQYNLNLLGRVDE